MSSLHRHHHHPHLLLQDKAEHFVEHLQNNWSLLLKIMRNSTDDLALLLHSTVISMSTPAQKESASGLKVQLDEAESQRGQIQQLQAKLLAFRNLKRQQLAQEAAADAAAHPERAIAAAAKAKQEAETYASLMEIATVAQNEARAAQGRLSNLRRVAQSQAAQAQAQAQALAQLAAGPSSSDAAAAATAASAATAMEASAASAEANNAAIAVAEVEVTTLHAAATKAAHGANAARPQPLQAPRDFFHEQTMAETQVCVCCVCVCVCV